MDSRRTVYDVQAPVRARIEGVTAPLKLELRHGATGASVVSKLGFLRRGAQITIDDPSGRPDSTARVARIHDVTVQYTEGGDVPELTIALGPIGVPREALGDEDLGTIRRFHAEALAPLLGGGTLAVLVLLALNL